MLYAMLSCCMKPVPEDVQLLAANLGLSGKRLRQLQKEHGKRLLKELQKRWRRNCREHPRHLAGAPVAETEGKRQRLSPEQELGYASTPFKAIDPLEALSKGEQELQSKAANEAWDNYRAHHRPQEYMAQELKRKGNRVRKLKADAIKAGIDIRAEYDAFIDALECKLGAAAQEVAS